MVFQMAQTLPVRAIDHARAPHGHAAYGEGGVIMVRIFKSGSQFLRTKAKPAEAVEQTKAPFTPPIRTNRAIFGIPVAANRHLRSALGKHTKYDTSVY